jgi:uncharacterized protein YxeA
MRKNAILKHAITTALLGSSVILSPSAWAVYCTYNNSTAGDWNVAWSFCNATPTTGDFANIVTAVHLNGATANAGTVYSSSGGTIDDVGSSGGSLTVGNISGSNPSINFTHNNSPLTITNGANAIQSGTISTGGLVSFTNSNVTISNGNTLNLSGTASNLAKLSAGGTVDFQGAGTYNLNYVDFVNGTWTKSSTGTFNITNCVVQSAANVPAGWGCTSPPPPTSPSNLNVSNVTQTSLTLNWNDNSNDETGFKVFRGGNLITTAGAGTTSFNDTSLTCGVTYNYEIKATNANGDSTAVTASATMQSCPIPTSPTNLNVSKVTKTSLTLNWNDNSNDETGFKVFRGGNLITTTGVGTTSFNDTGLTCGVTYNYEVKATNTGGDSTSVTASATTSACPPNTPTGLTATATSQTQIDLSWTDNSNDETGFKIEQPAGTLIQTTAAGATSYSHTGLTCGTSYNYEIKATNANGDSTSVTASATTSACPPNVPTGLTATATSQTQIDLSWTDNSSDETGFKIEQPAGTLIQTTAADATSYSHTGLTCGTSYNYEIKATNANGDTTGVTVSAITQACSTPPPLSVPTPISNEPPSLKILNVGINGNGEGVILSKPNGIDCARTENAICQNEFAMGTSITLTATPTEGSEFIGWSSNCNNGEFTINRGMECIATFKLLPKTLTVIINGNGSIKSIPLALNCDETTEKCSHTFTAGSQIKLTATSEVMTWEGDCDENGLVVLTTDKACTANFVQETVETLPVIVPQPEVIAPPEETTPVITPPPVVTPPEEPTSVPNLVTLTVTKVGNGTIINQRQDFICHSDSEQCTYTVESGETVTLTATPGNGWQFESWNGDCDKTGKITLSANQACEANFILISAPLPIQPIPIMEPVPLPVQPISIVDLVSPMPPTPIVETPIVEEVPITTTTEPPEIVVPIITEDGTTKMVTKPVIPPSDGKPLCPTTGIVNWVCDAKWQELTQMIIETQGNVANGIVIDTLINRGRFGNIQIREGAVVQCEGKNSTVSGYIDNQGTLIDCNFKGREIKDGTLSGTITNTSDIDGYFQDVYLVPETHISGGELRGKITTDPETPAVISNVTIAAGSVVENVIVGDKVVVSLPKKNEKPAIFKDIILAPNARLTGGQLEGFVRGDPEAPARLENVTVSPNSNLDNVSLGENITFLSDNVTLGEWVQIITPPTIIPSDEQDEQEVACTNGNGVDIEGNMVEQACFEDGIKTEAGVQANGVKLTSTQAKTLQLSMTVNILPKHRDKAAKVIMVAEHKPSPGNAVYYMRDGENWRAWDVNIDSLKPANSHKRLPSKLKVIIFEGDLSNFSGEFKIFVGYQLVDGTLIYNGKKPLHFFVDGN